ncbi:nitroreductase family deazaflavin-dependent oxidoreductase [Mariniluteicoccus flavus]
MPVPLKVTKYNRDYLNKLLIRLAGSGTFVDLEHVGRKSGTVFHTPLMAFRHGDAVTIALTYGPNVQWLKNITAAGRCRMRLGDSLLHLGVPRTIPAEIGAERLPQPQRTLVKHVFHIVDYIELPITGEEPW